MIKKIFIVRHGEAMHQVNGDVWDVCANKDIGLTALGKQQAKQCGDFLANEGLSEKNALIMCSPYLRAEQTAEQIQEQIPDIEIEKDALLCEQDFGLFTGLSTPKCYEIYPREAKIYDMQEALVGGYYVKPPKGESRADVVERASEFITKIQPILRDSQYENMIIVSHCLVGRSLIKVLTEQTTDSFMKEPKQENGSIKQLCFENGVWVSKGIVFMPDEKSENISIAERMPSSKEL